MAYGAVLNQRNYWTPIIQITGDYSTPDYTFTLTKDGTTTTTTGTANETLLYPWEFGEYTVSISDSGQSVVQSFTVEINSVKLYQFSFPQTTPSTGASGSNFQEFTSDGTFIVPSGITTIYVTACGGGGSGAGSGRSDRCGSGGCGAACIYQKIFNVIPNMEIEITIGQGGTRVDGKSGNNGSSTVIGNLITLPGGDGGDITPTGQSGIKQSGGGLGANAFITGMDLPAVCAYGQDGRIGKGGWSDVGTTSASNLELKVSYTGGGGSLGDGGSRGMNPGYGGGGYGSKSDYSQAGGNGYVLIEW